MDRTDRARAQLQDIPNVDLWDLLETFHTIERLLGPYKSLARGLKDLICWKRPSISVTVASISTLLGYWWPALLWLVICLMLLCWSWWCLTPRSLIRHDYVSQATIDAHSFRSSVTKDQLDPSEDQRQTLKSLVRADTFADESCRFLIKIDKLQRQSEFRRKACGFFAAIAIICQLVPANWLTVLATLSVFIAGAKVEVFPIHTKIPSKSEMRIAASPNDASTSPTIGKDSSSPSAGRSIRSHATPDVMTVDAGPGSYGHTKEECRSVAGSNSSSKPKCSSCDAEIGTLFKKRVYCKHCGAQFCSSCCGNKVPKSLFGATAPQARIAKVIVCNQCKSYLQSQNAAFMVAPGGDPTSLASILLADT